jgi:hypothetical protein
LWGIKVNAQWLENRPESPDDVRLRFELLLTAMNDMSDLRRYIRDEQDASVKRVMLEELISVMNKVRYYLDSLEG